ncbi:Eco57I restriction-modification methylase domain-containing protein [Sediminitomix flava]|uniref:site-specific DNA-methyltransferase (adenine-specific) n=1 Tax=Sediminitomix flava TaxID=379075 RepID=A0A315ZY08_SEDFL|nr:DNA methyltransferase [Sediminitomix flava]PWJ42227.1 hypothetical protein BC781_103479 [Sediminitomix flava]
MSFTAINIQGNIISGEILDRIAKEEDYKFQKPKDFGFIDSEELREEIGNAWHDARHQYQRFKRKEAKLLESNSAISETKLWVLSFLGNLGYVSENATAETIHEKKYAISHRDKDLGEFPIHIVGWRTSLDKKQERTADNRSPHALVQEYLNYTEHLYGLVTNGKQLRLLRDATRLAKLSFLEFDLEKIMEEELYAEFALLYRVLHKTRAPQQKGEGEDSYWEKYHIDALESGSRIREKLSAAVETSIIELANGFLKHEQNTALRAELANKKIDEGAFYLSLLRMVYRMLFLMVTEERNLIFPKPNGEGDQYAQMREIYYRYYSLSRIKKLVEQKHFIAKYHHDLWESLKTCFAIFESQTYAEKLGLRALSSGLFSPNALGVLAEVKLSNEVFLKVLSNLSYFENEKKQLVRVNFSDLDVEEFGSVYEGLLEYKPAFVEESGHPKFQFVKGDDRSSSGSHYTPEELVKPLIKHSLAYQIEDRLEKPQDFIAESSRTKSKAEQQEEALLGLKVCDVACGSGHILLSAARRIAFDLAVVRTQEEQPNPTALRTAVRDVIRHCIYGVDLNPLAVELCKVALWLEAHNPNEPLNFLDHHIKCGNAIVGLAHADELKNGIADEAFKKLAGDDKEVIKEFSTRNKQQRKNRGQLQTFDVSKTSIPLKEVLEKHKEIVAMPESTPEEIQAKEQAYYAFAESEHARKIQILADLQIAQFFIPKTDEHRRELTTDSDYYQFLQGKKVLQGQGVAKAMALGEQKHFFHWFLEFPQVMAKGGFDCILGNPPFLGGQMLSGNFGLQFVEFIKHYYAPIDTVNLVTYFFRRNFDLISENKFISLISTDAISDGKNRAGGLEVICGNKGEINFALKNIVWPGDDANLEVSLISIYKGKFNGVKYLDKENVNQINPDLSSSNNYIKPFQLKQNKNKSFQGPILLGDGFVLSKKEADSLISVNDNNRDVIQPYQNGSELNSNIYQETTRYAINFFDWAQEQAENYTECFEIVKNKVLPFRKTTLGKKEVLNSRDKRVLEQYWKYEAPRPSLYSKLKNVKRYFRISTGGTKYVVFAPSSEEIVFSHTIAIIALESFYFFGFLSSSIYDHWAWSNCRKKGGATLRYAPTTAFETFPFIDKDNFENHNFIENISEVYSNSRNELMHLIQLGLTKTYNQFHNPRLTSEVELLKKADFEKQYGKETWNLYNHLEVNKAGKVSYQEAVPMIEELRLLHKEMDQAVLEAYGWGDIQLRHDFYEVEYLPENDRIRYTIHPEARKEVLKRLLLLNHERYEEEVAQGLHTKGKKKTATKPKPKATAKATKKASTPPQATGDLFGGTATQTNIQKEVTIGSRVVIRNLQTKNEMKVTLSAEQNPTPYDLFGHQNLKITSQMALAMLNRKAGSKFRVGDAEWEILRVE